jgi:LuxR family maltose regulon positive regulatory protein
VSYLLNTKLNISPVQADMVRLPRLLAKLQEGLSNPLIVVCTQARFSKTPLLVEWHESKPGKDFPMAWLSLEDEDNLPAKFITYLVAAMETLESGNGAATQSLLNSPDFNPLKTVLTSLIEGLGGFAKPFALVFDACLAHCQVHRQSLLRRRLPDRGGARRCTRRGAYIHVPDIALRLFERAFMQW